VIEREINGLRVSEGERKKGREDRQGNRVRKWMYGKSKAEKNRE
jgi:hypothetical protein